MIIKEALKENDIIINYVDHKNLKYFTVRGKALFECVICNFRWSSHNATIKVDLYRRRVVKSYAQKCKRCYNWVSPKFTADQFREVIGRVIQNYHNRKSQLLDDGDIDTLIVDNTYERNPQAPHEQSLCERCAELGRPCW